MKQRNAISGLAALLIAAAGIGLSSASAAAQLRSGAANGGNAVLAQIRSEGPGFERYGGPGNESGSRRQALPDKQVWGIAQGRVPGRVVSAHLRGAIYSFRIISQRGNIVDVDVDRFQGRVVSVRGGP